MKKNAMIVIEKLKLILFIVGPNTLFYYFLINNFRIRK